MPVQINEVIVRTNVDQSSTTAQNSGTAQQVAHALLHENEIAEQIIKIIKASKER